MTTVKNLLKQLTGRTAPQAAKSLTPAETWVANGRLPWADGYWQAKRKAINTTLQDPALMDDFRHNRPLPTNFGFRLDERIVEYPWIFSRLQPSTAPLLDAGATLIFPYLLARPNLKDRPLVVCTLPMDNKKELPAHASMVYADLRRNPLAAGRFQDIVCISTLEHVGLDNTLYTTGPRFQESRPSEYRLVLHEFRRLLMPGGSLFLTVPYGRYQNLGWLQQFDESLLAEAFLVFGGRLLDAAFYRYHPTGWQLSEAADCANCDYFDIHQSNGTYDPDHAAAARAVACLQLIKD